MVNLVNWFVVLASGVPSDLLNNNGIVDKIFQGGNGTNKSDVINFYLDWHNVLHTDILAVQKIIGTVNGWLLLGLYHMAQALESVFMAVLKLFCFFANFNVGEMGTLYKTIVLLGFALLTIGLGYLLVENIFRAKTKLHEVVTNLVVVIAILVMLPFGTNLFSQFVTAGAQDIVGNNGSGVTSIAVQPVQNNIVDSVALAKKGFDVNPAKLDGQMDKYNGINADNIGYLDLSEVIASDNLKTNAIPKGVDNIFKHRVKMGAETNQYTVEDATLPSKQSQLTKAFESVYPRYTGHFVIADLQLLLLACMFGLIAFRVGKSWFEILMLNASAPLMGFQDLRTNQRLKEVLQAIQGSFIGIFAEMIGLRLFLIALDYLGSADNPGVAFLKQYPNSALPIGFFLVLMYLSCFVAFMSGVSLIERWTGVPQSKNGTALGALMGLGLGLTAAGKVVKAGGKGVKAGVKGISMAREGMKGSYQKMVDGLTGEASALPDPTKATQAKDQQQMNPTTGQPTMDRADQGDQPKSNQQLTNEETETSAEAGRSAKADPSSQAAPDGTETATGDGADKTVTPMSDPTVKPDQEPDKASDEKLPDPTAGVTADKNTNQGPTKETGTNANGNLPDPTTEEAPTDEAGTATAKETEASPEGTLPDPTAGVTTDKGTNQGPAKATDTNLNGTLPDPTTEEAPTDKAGTATAKETEASLEGTIPNPTVEGTVPSNDDQQFDQGAPTVGAEVNSADRPEGLTREDGASEPRSRPAHGDQANKGVIPEGVISDYEEDEREVFERPVDDQPEWPVDRQSGSVNDGAPSDRTTTPPQSSHEVKSASGRQPVVANGPKRAAGKHLIKSGSMMTAAAREHGNDEQSMVNLPEIKIDDSIY
ncbi:pLS20_p028 family conjugation system transmembrane protein (plasmid) [Lactiplantibacillus plantarum]|uniref:pLS20_p028 family conjugation system transmembrane protein n=1 Tax=Lactiplantibacillus plantarum TaxID=1590 RepID=UPI00338DBA89